MNFIFNILFTLFSIINKNINSIKWIFISHPIYQNMIAELGKEVCCRMGWHTGVTWPINLLCENICLSINRSANTIY